MKDLPTQAPSPLAHAPTWSQLALGSAGIGVWVLFNAVIVHLVWQDPRGDSVLGAYADGALGWWKGKDIFGSGPDGFLYLPSFAVLFTPFAKLGAPLGDAAWRVLSAGLLAYGIWRFLRLLLPDASWRWMATALGVALLLTVPGGGAALRDGQASTMLMALCLLAAAEIAAGRSWPAAALLALALAVKPLAFVLLLLAAALHPKLLRPLAACLAAVLLLPFIHPDPGRVWQLYGLGAQKLLTATDPGRATWSDLGGLLDYFGLGLDSSTMTLVRLLSAAATLALAFLSRLRRPRTDAALDLLALSVCYLMLMSPRTEEQTYIMLTAVVALYAMAVWLRESKPSAAIWLAVLCLALGNQGYGDWIYRPTELWWKPLLALVFFLYVAARCLAFAVRRPAAAGKPVRATLPASAE